MKFKVKIIENAYKFILSLPTKLKIKVDRTIFLLEKYGYNLTMPFSKKIKGSENLYELRIKLASNICRLFYFYHKDKIYIITSGYIKKNNKTGKREIKKAIAIMKNYGRHENEK